jgi:hypothetical protein
MGYLPTPAPLGVELKVSLGLGWGRLLQEDLPPRLDPSAGPAPPGEQGGGVGPGEVRLDKASFQWSKVASTGEGPTVRDVDLAARRGQLVCVYGARASGEWDAHARHIRGTEPPGFRQCSAPSGIKHM